MPQTATGPTRTVKVQRLRTVPTELIQPDPLDVEPYPQPRNPDLPRMFWLGAKCGQRGAGKTQSAIRLLKSYEECGIVNEQGKTVDQRIVLFSPTFEANPAFKRLKHLAKADVHTKYTDAALVTVMEEVKADRHATRKYKQACYLWKQFWSLTKRDIDPLLKMRREDLNLLAAETNGFRSAPVEPPHPLGQACFIVLDDCLSSAAFSLNRLNKFVGLCLNNRHYWCNILILSQRAKQIPPAIRANLSLLCHWRLMSRKALLEEVWPMVSNLLTEDDFLALYEAATVKPHDCLTVDTTAEPGKQFKRNMSEILSFA